MQRRTFLQSLLGALATPLLAASEVTAALRERTSTPARRSFTSDAALVPPTPGGATTTTGSATSGAATQPGTPITINDENRRIQAQRTTRRLLLQESPLAGFQYHAGERLWPLMLPGAPLTLRREPGNTHDERAIALFYAGQRIGYVPRMENTAVSQLMDRGERLDAHIVALRESSNPWERVRLAVYWEGSSR